MELSLSIFASEISCWLLVNIYLREGERGWEKEEIVLVGAEAKSWIPGAGLQMLVNLIFSMLDVLISHSKIVLPLFGHFFFYF